MSKRSMFPDLPPGKAVAGQVLTWGRAVMEQRDRLMRVRVPKKYVSPEGVGYIYDATFFCVAMLNLIRSARAVHDVYKEVRIRDALQAFTERFPEREIAKGRHVLNYAHQYARGVGKQQRKDPSGDFEIWWNEEWDGDAKKDFIVRVGADFRVSTNEAADAAEKLYSQIYQIVLSLPDT